MYECSKSNGNIVVMTKNTCYLRLDRVWNIQVETTENSISRFLDFNIFGGSNLPQEIPGGSPLWRSQHFPLLRNIRISTNTPSQTPGTRLDLRTHNEEMRQLINDFESTAPVNDMQSAGHYHVYSKERGCESRGHAATSFILHFLTCYLCIHYYNWS